ncbi:hypothetical protein V8E53_012290 [Lactarius tabidus]
MHGHKVVLGVRPFQAAVIVDGLLSSYALLLSVRSLDARPHVQLPTMPCKKIYYQYPPPPFCKERGISHFLCRLGCDSDTCLDPTAQCHQSACDVCHAHSHSRCATRA